jgi:hypothetical protein
VDEDASFSEGRLFDLAGAKAQISCGHDWHV